MVKSFNKSCDFFRLCSVRRRKLGKGWPLSFNVEFESKIGAKSFTLSVEEDKTSGPFIIVDTPALVSDFPELFDLGLNHLCIATVFIFQNLLAAIAGGSDCS